MLADPEYGHPAGPASDDYRTVLAVPMLRQDRILGVFTIQGTKDIDWEEGVAWLYFKVENDLKTEGSEAPFGLPEATIKLDTDPLRFHNVGCNRLSD